MTTSSVSETSALTLTHNGSEMASFNVSHSPGLSTPLAPSQNVSGHWANSTSSLNVTSAPSIVNITQHSNTSGVPSNAHGNMTLASVLDMLEPETMTATSMRRQRPPRAAPTKVAETALSTESAIGANSTSTAMVNDECYFDMSRLNLTETVVPERKNETLSMNSTLVVNGTTMSPPQTTMSITPVKVPVVCHNQTQRDEWVDDEPLPTPPPDFVNDDGFTTVAATTTIPLATHSATTSFNVSRASADVESACPDIQTSLDQLVADNKTTPAEAVALCVAMADTEVRPVQQVTIRLNEPFEPEGTLSPSEVTTQRQRLQQAAQGFRDAACDSNITATATIAQTCEVANGTYFTPDLHMRLDKDGLEQVINQAAVNKNVAHIEQPTAVSGRFIEETHRAGCPRVDPSVDTTAHPPTASDATTALSSAPCRYPMMTPDEAKVVAIVSDGVNSTAVAEHGATVKTTHCLTIDLAGAANFCNSTETIRGAGECKTSAKKPDATECQAGTVIASCIAHQYPEVELFDLRTQYFQASGATVVPMTNPLMLADGLAWLCEHHAEHGVRSVVIPTVMGAPMDSQEIKDLIRDLVSKNVAVFRQTGNGSYVAHEDTEHASADGRFDQHHGFGDNPLPRLAAGFGALIITTALGATLIACIKRKKRETVVDEVELHDLSPPPPLSPDDPHGAGEEGGTTTSLLPLPTYQEERKAAWAGAAAAATATV